MVFQLLGLRHDNLVSAEGKRDKLAGGSSVDAAIVALIRTEQKFLIKRRAKNDTKSWLHWSWRNPIGQL